MLNFTGIWVADLSRSTFVGASPSALQVRIDHRDPELKEELVVTKAEGTQDRAVFICRVTGEQDHAELNGSSIRALARWVGQELVIETWMELGSRETYFCDCWSLTPDGRTLVMEHRKDALAGQRVVLNRVS